MQRSPAHRLEYRRIETLKPHEEIKLKKADRLLNHMRRTRIMPKPILIDRNTGIILDGHHRFSVCKELGCERIPCIAIDYLNDPSIRVVARHRGEHVTKEDVVKMGLSGNVFPPKTTKHLYDYPEMEKSVPLKFLTLAKHPRIKHLSRKPTAQ